MSGPERPGPVGNPVCVLPTLFHWLWTHRISADVESRDLGAGTLVWIGQPLDRHELR